MEKHSSDDVFVKHGSGRPPGWREARRVTWEAQAIQDRPNHGRVGDQCDQLPSPLTERTFQHVEFENPPHQLRPGISPLPLRCRGVLRHRRSTPLSCSHQTGRPGIRNHEPAPRRVRRQDSVVRHQIRPGRRDQRTELLDKGQWIEDHRTGPVMKRMPEPIPDPAVGKALEAF